MDDLLLRLQAMRPVLGGVPTVLVAANEAAGATTPAALALGRAVAEAGHRVLVIEADGARAALAAATDPDADPIVVDLFGTLRVALPAESGAGSVHLAPSFAQGKRIASALVADRTTRLVDEIAEAFDLMIVDAGRAGDRAAAAWSPDALIRVGASVSAREDERLADAFDMPHAMVIGTYLSSRFVATADRHGAESQATPFEMPAPRAVARPQGVRSLAPSRVAPARPIPARRKVGGR